MCVREEADISELILATECGGSDPTSGLAANPTLGYVSDKLVGMGATSILSETTELMGTEDILCLLYTSRLPMTWRLTPSMRTL